MKPFSHYNYFCLRPALRTGDAIFFEGKGLISDLICLVAGGPSHVALVERTDDRIRLVESTSQRIGAKWIIGVQRTYLSDRLRDYDGHVWWAPLKNEYSVKVVGHSNKFFAYLDMLHGKRYDFWQVMRKGWQLLNLPRVFPVRESPRRLFCSELAALAYKHMGVLPESINASTVSPRELASFNLYVAAYQLAGPKSKDLPVLNTKEVKHESREYRED